MKMAPAACGSLGGVCGWVVKEQGRAKLQEGGRGGGMEGLRDREHGHVKGVSDAR